MPRTALPALPSHAADPARVAHRGALPVRVGSAAIALGVALAAGVLAAPAGAAPVAPAPGASVSAAAVVTPPTSVSRASLVRLMRHAGHQTDRGLRSGAQVRSLSRAGGQTSTSSGRVRQGRAALTTSTGERMLLDYRSGTGYVRIADLIRGSAVTPEQLHQALTELGKPDARWASIGVSPSRAGSPSFSTSTRDGLVEVAETASNWRWRRAHGLTTWRFAPAGARAELGALVLGLDPAQRIRRQTTSSSLTLRLGRSRSTTFTSTSTTVLRYRPVAPIVLPTSAQAVDLVELVIRLAQLETPSTARTIGALESSLRSLQTLTGG